MRRYPHTATITIETVSDDPIPVVTSTTLEIKGRYEPAGQRKDLDQSAKFYCDRLDILKDNPNALNGKEMLFEGRTIGISQAWNYQMHCEIWLD